MTAEDLEVLSGFEAVWARVSGARVSEGQGGQRGTEALLQGLWELERGCRRMAQRAAGEARCCLLGLAREASELYSQWETAYFLETGDRYIQRETENFASYTPYNLRKLYKFAEGLAEAAASAHGPYAGDVEAAQARIEEVKATVRCLLCQSLR